MLKKVAAGASSVATVTKKGNLKKLEQENPEQELQTEPQQTPQQNLKRKLENISNDSANSTISPPSSSFSPEQQKLAENLFGRLSCVQNELEKANEGFKNVLQNSNNGSQPPLKKSRIEQIPEFVKNFALFFGNYRQLDFDSRTKWIRNLRNLERPIVEGFQEFIVALCAEDFKRRMSEFNSTNSAIPIQQQPQPQQQFFNDSSSPSSEQERDRKIWFATFGPDSKEDFELQHELEKEFP